MDEIIVKMTFKDYYSCLRNAAVDMRDRICSELDIAYETFYYKLRNNSFTEEEQDKISKITGRPCLELFPEKQ